MSTVNATHEINKGLIADYIIDHNDFFAMVSLDIRFAKPGGDEHIDKDALFAIEKLFLLYLIENDYKDKIIHFGSIGDTGIDLNLNCSFDVRKSLELVKDMCQYILDMNAGEPSDHPLVSAIQLGLDAAKEVIVEYLAVVDSNYVQTETAI